MNASDGYVGDRSDGGFLSKFRIVLLLLLALSIIAPSAMAIDEVIIKHKEDDTWSSRAEGASPWEFCHRSDGSGEPFKAVAIGFIDINDNPTDDPDNTINWKVVITNTKTDETTVLVHPADEGHDKGDEIEFEMPLDPPGSYTLTATAINAENAGDSASDTDEVRVVGPTLPRSVERFKCEPGLKVKEPADDSKPEITGRDTETGRVTASFRVSAEGRDRMAGIESATIGGKAVALGKTTGSRDGPFDTPFSTDVSVELSAGESAVKSVTVTNCFGATTEGTIEFSAALTEQARTSIEALRDQIEGYQDQICDLLQEGKSPEDPQIKELQILISDTEDEIPAEMARGTEIVVSHSLESFVGLSSTGDQFSVGVVPESEGEKVGISTKYYSRAHPGGTNEITPRAADDGMVAVDRARLSSTPDTFRPHIRCTPGGFVEFSYMSCTNKIAILATDITLARTLIGVNDDNDKEQTTPQGCPVPDRDVPPPPAGDDDLVGATLRIASPSSIVCEDGEEPEEVKGRWSITYPDNVRAWRVASGGLELLGSGQSSEVVSPPVSVELRFEGIKPSAEPGDVSVSAAFSPTTCAPAGSSDGTSATVLQISPPDYADFVPLYESQPGLKVEDPASGSEADITHRDQDTGTVTVEVPVESVCRDRMAHNESATIDGSAAMLLHRKSANGGPFDSTMGGLVTAELTAGHRKVVPLSVTNEFGYTTTRNIILEASLTPAAEDKISQLQEEIAEKRAEISSLLEAGQSSDSEEIKQLEATIAEKENRIASETAQGTEVEVSHSLDQFEGLSSRGDPLRIEVEPELPGEKIDLSASYYSTQYPDGIRELTPEEGAGGMVAVEGANVSFASDAFRPHVRGPSAGGSIGVTYGPCEREVSVVEIDLDIDSDNDNEFISPDRSDAEDASEYVAGDPEYPGKILEKNDDDDDYDGIPDFADGFNWDGIRGNDDDVTEGEKFVPVVVALPEPIDVSRVKIRFSYDAANPEEVTRTGAGTKDDPYRYTSGNGHLRLWSQPGETPRERFSIASAQDPGHYVPSGTYLDPGVLGFDDSTREITLYVEAIAQTNDPVKGSIKIELEPNCNGPTDIKCSDIVRTTIFSLTACGAYRFGSLHKGTIVELPSSHAKGLQATHLLFPSDCRIDDSRHRAMGLLHLPKLADQAKTEVITLQAENGDYCMLIHPEMYEGAYWDAYRYIVNTWNDLFGWGHITAESMYQDLYQGYGMTQQQANSGEWWQTPAYGTSGYKSPIWVQSPGGDKVQDTPLRVLIKQPIKIETIVPSSGNVKRFEKMEAKITLDEEYFHHVSPGREHFDANPKGMDQGDLFDSYDADHDGERIQVDARFRLMSGGETDTLVGDHSYEVPCFPMKAAPNGSFNWKVRFSPPEKTSGTQYWELTVRALVWHKAKGDTQGNYDEFNRKDIPNGTGKTYYHYYGYNQSPFGNDNQHKDSHQFYNKTDPISGKTYDSMLPIPRLRFRCEQGQKNGPLSIAKKDENDLYLHQMQKQSNGNYDREPFFILGQARPWAHPAGTINNGWHDGINRQDELYPKMKNANMNFNYTWFAPWETQLVHNEQKEHWYSSGSIQETDPPPGWDSHSYYDQGRARRMDDIVEGHEDNGIYMALTVWAHQSLQKGGPGGHPWGETGWDEKPDDEEENGFSGFDDEINNFFACAADQTSEGWLWQKDFYRYMIARWGYSRTLAVWVTIDELEGVGDSTSYWWKPDKDTDDWHDRLLTTVRELDWRQRPCTASTTHWQRNRNPYDDGEEIDGEKHGNWTGGNEKIDMLSQHAYHYVYHPMAYPPREYLWTNAGDDIWQNISQQQALIWHYVVARMHTWATNTSSSDAPHLVTEYGIVERNTPSVPFCEDVLRSYLHFAIWGAFANGHAGTPLKWCDGKEFGEMFPRGSNEFASYPDLGEEMQSLQKLVTQHISLKSLEHRIKPDVRNGSGGSSSVRAFGLKGGGDYAVWLFDDDFNSSWGNNWGKSTRSYANAQQGSKGSHKLILKNVPAGNYQVKRYNTWTGAIRPGVTVTPDGNGDIIVPVGKFATDDDHAAKTWDGADILLLIEKK